jgi:hypothetical protein
MHNTLLLIHSLLRWAILLAGIWAVLRAFMGVSGKSAFTGADKKAGLFFMIFFDLQLVAGLLLYFVTSPIVKTALADMKFAMKESVLRFYAVEHITMALIAFVLVHIGYSKVKKATTDAQKHKTALIFFGIALLLVLLLTPWPFRIAGAGRGWI